MIKLQTPVAETPCKTEISYGDKILLLGSCFSDNIGRTLLDYGFDALVNPFGTLYNPASIRAAVERLTEGEEFTREDCVPMGSGVGKICSFSHHTSFARSTEDEFLENANSALRTASAYFRSCNKVIITLGTAWCYLHNGKIVSNCLKRDSKEFMRERMSLAECVDALIYIIGICSGSNGSETGNTVSPKDIIFTVSPIRHLADGAHGNQLSKSTLLLAVDEVVNHAPTTGETCGNGNPEARKTGAETDYFPAYEIMMDELRDYRFYAEDMVHPSVQAIAHIADRFLARHLSPADKPLLEERVRLHKQSLHRPNL